MSRTNKRGKRKGIFDIFREKAEQIIEDVAVEVQKQKESQKTADDAICEEDKINFDDYPTPDVLSPEDVVMPPKPEIQPEDVAVVTPPKPAIQPESVVAPEPVVEAVTVSDKKDNSYLDDLLGDKDTKGEDVYDDLQTTIPRDEIKIQPPVVQPAVVPVVPKKEKDASSQIGKQLSKMKNRHLNRHSSLIVKHREKYLAMVTRHRELEEALLGRQKEEEEAIAKQHEGELIQAKDMVTTHLTQKGSITKKDLKQVTVVIRGGRNKLKNRRGRVRTRGGKKG
ncbi:MAG: hypothetical protein AB8B69_00480 [Chitinophagales bacterium]